MRQIQSETVGQRNSAEFRFQCTGGLPDCSCEVVVLNDAQVSQIGNRLQRVCIALMRAQNRRRLRIN